MTQNLVGWFDVKVYNERVARENWKLKGEEDNIAFGVTFAATDPQAMQYTNHAKPYTDNNGNNRMRVTFKITPRCRWFNEQAQPVAKPCNAELDGRQFECIIRYNELVGDPANSKSPRGFWADAIQFREVVTNPFQAMADTQPVPQPQMAAQPMGAPMHQQQQPSAGMGTAMPPMYRQQQQQPQPQPTGNIGFPPPPPEDLFAPRDNGLPY